MTDRARPIAPPAESDRGRPHTACGRSAAREALRAASNVLIVSGALLLLEVVFTVVWQEPISAIYTRLKQQALVADLAGSQDLTALQQAELARLRTERRRVAFLAGLMARSIKFGQPLGHIRIRRIHVDFVVAQGTDPQSLRGGPGHYPDTPLPGEPGTVAIAGHRTTFLAPFRRLNLLRPGDQIVLETSYGRFVYRTESRRIVLPTSYGYVTRRMRYDRLALTACHPIFTARQRIVVFARLLSTHGRGHARSPL